MTESLTVPVVGYRAEAADEISLQISLVVPAYNEAGRIAATLNGLHAELAQRWGSDYEVLVVDDGSIDATAAIAEENGARVVRLPRNQGKGAAVKAGLEAAAGETVGFMDADGAIAPSEVAKLLEAVGGGADMAVASRAAEEASESGPRTLPRRLGSLAFRGVCKAVLPSDVADTQCGAKVMHRGVAETLCRQQTVDGFAFDAEWLWLARQEQFRVAEVPVSVQNRNDSSVTASRAAVMLADVIRIRYRHRRSAAADSQSVSSTTVLSP